MRAACSATVVEASGGACQVSARAAGTVVWTVIAQYETKVRALQDVACLRVMQLGQPGS